MRDRKGTAIPESSARERLVPAPFHTQASFLAAIRAGEPTALRQLFLFYSPLLRDQARQLGIARDERDALVTTVLDDVVMFLQDAALLPRDIGRYLVGALRNRARNAHRDATRQLARQERAYTLPAPTGQRIVAECHSEYSVRNASAAAEVDIPRVAHVITELAAAVARALTEAETRLLVGLSRNVPLRDLAHQAGITYGAARVRLHRVRGRLPAVAREFRRTLSPEDQRELDRFFRRAGITLATEDRSVGDHDPRTSAPSSETTDDHS